MNHSFRVFKSLTLALLISVVGFGHSVRAQDGHGHRHDSSELGEVNFPTSCNPAAQKQFNRAVAWLHSFEYEEAEKEFSAVTTTDPRCGMGYWGVAMSNYHPLWVPPTPAELKKGFDAVEKAKATGAKTRA